MENPNKKNKITTLQYAILIFLGVIYQMRAEHDYFRSWKDIKDFITAWYNQVAEYNNKKK